MKINLLANLRKEFNMKRRDLLGCILAFLGFGLAEKESNASLSKEKAPKWLEETEKESRESYFKRLENIAKAREILRKYSDFTTSELECVRKAICKSKTGYEKQCKEFRNRFYMRPHASTSIWDAICVTYRTGGREDGFELIDCKFPEEPKVDEIAQFKRFSDPLVRRLYPPLLG